MPSCSHKHYLNPFRMAGSKYGMPPFLKLDPRRNQLKNLGGVGLAGEKIPSVAQPQNSWFICGPKTITRGEAKGFGIMFLPAHVKLPVLTELPGGWISNLKRKYIKYIIFGMDF